MKRNNLIPIIFMMLVPLIFNFQTVKAQQGDSRMPLFIADIAKAKKQVDKYVSPKEQIYLVDEAGDDWLLRAISISTREEWINTTEMSKEEVKKINADLDALAEAANKKLPLYKPDNARFAHGTKEEIDLMKSKVPNLSDLIVHKIGIADDTWTIVKNDLGIPKYRTKAGYMWFRRNMSDMDHPFCRVYQINISQDYEGGGTYGTSHAGYVMKWLCGCP